MRGQMSLSGERGWPRDDREMPAEVRENPELTLVWRGLEISIATEQMTRKQAFEIIKGALGNPPDLHDIGPDGEPAA